MRTTRTTSIAALVTLLAVSQSALIQGCASAQADEPQFTECSAMVFPRHAGKADQLEDRALSLPAGWTVIGGIGDNSILLCR